jgi:hypothetical protein
MTRKHFIRAAEIVRTLVEVHNINSFAAPLIADAFIELFRAYNDRFDADRFLQACGLVEKGSTK